MMKKRSKGIVFLSLLLLLLGCGSTVLLIRMDILTFLPDESIVTAYGPIPGIGIPVSIRTPAETIPLPDEFHSVTDIRSVEISTVIEFRNETGEATLSYLIYFHEEEANIFRTPPVVDRSVDLSAGTDFTDEIVVAGDDRILSLFDGDQIVVAAEVRVVPGGGSEEINGEAELLDFIVTIVAAGERE